MIKNFCCTNFKNITTDNLEFEKINVLIGHNHVGKRCNNDNSKY